MGSSLRAIFFCRVFYDNVFSVSVMDQYLRGIRRVDPGVRCRWRACKRNDREANRQIGLPRLVVTGGIQLLGHCESRSNFKPSKNLTLCRHYVQIRRSGVRRNSSCCVVVNALFTHKHTHARSWWLVRELHTVLGGGHVRTLR